MQSLSMEKRHETAITVIGEGLDSSVENRAARIVKETGVGSLRINTLHPGYAIDIIVNSIPPELTAILYKKLAALGPFDVFIQPDDGFRKKKLLIADMDATIIQQETLDELAAHFGLRDKIAPITEKAMRGEIDFDEALRMRVRELKGLPMETLAETLRDIRYSPGAAALIKTMNLHGAKCILVSGGFDFFTNHVAATLGFYRNFGNRLGVENGKLTGEVLPPILDRHAKERLVTEMAKDLGCDLRHVVAIGDGANDIPMLKKAGTGVGYFGKPAVTEATPCQIRHTSLISALYMQGYRRDEIAGAKNLLQSRPSRRL
ncbi:MAG: phosphoserine phosphatase SerB [Pseudomonadota bacterium]